MMLDLFSKVITLNIEDKSRVDVDFDSKNVIIKGSDSLIVIKGGGNKIRIIGDDNDIVIYGKNNQIKIYGKNNKPRYIVDHSILEFNAEQ